MRVHPENITADDTDVLAGTALDNLEAGGQLDIYVVATQADWLITITGPDSEPIVQAGEIPMATRTISIADDPSYSIPVRTGGHFTVSVDVNTAGTGQFIALYRKRGVDF